MAMVATVEVMVATGTARGLLRLRLSPDTATAAAMVVMVATVVATMARGLLMLSLRLTPLLRLSPVTVIVAAMAMAATDMAEAMDTTARGRPRLSPAMATGATE